ncbi:(2,3-dihydroxybenzoyl)adenylate synthase [Aliivibrio fischeri]|nr:AMP-binding protein [Aliivibrio fischeri]MUK51029.1 AMP-binding protein [Aliivibrio fischeri]
MEDYYQQQVIWQDQPIWKLITSIAERLPEKIAICGKQGTMSYRELVQQADEYASGFISQGLMCDDRVILQISNRIEFISLLLGLFRAGIVPVLTLPAHGYKEIYHFIQVSGAKAFISDQEVVAEQLEHYQALKNNDPWSSICKIYSFSSNTNQCDLFPHKEITGFTPPQINPANPALFLVSGGTTGLPKLIPRTHNDYNYNIACASKACELTEADTYLTVLPAGHNFPLGCPGMLGILANGGTVLMSQDPSPDECFELIEQYKVTVTALVPALSQLWTKALEWEDVDLSSLRLIQVGGAKLCESDALAMQRGFPNKLQQVFGMAEGLICCTRIGDAIEVITQTQGRPISLLDEIKIVDNKGVQVLQGEDGELLTRGPYTLRGYYRAQQHNQRSFSKDGFYCSGDKVKIDENGNIIVTGRIKDVVNRGGETIVCDEVEGYLLSHPDILHVAVIGIPDPDMGELVAAAIVTSSQSLSLIELKAFLLAQGIAKFKLPERLQVMSDLPLTAVGKIDKKILANMPISNWKQN